MFTQYGPPPWCAYATTAERIIGSPPVSFTLDGRAFEVQMSSYAPSFAVLVDGAWSWSGGAIRNQLANGVAGASLDSGLQNCWVKFDFGSRAVRQVVVHNFSGGAIQNVGRESARDVMLPLDRSHEPVAVAITDSYGQEPPVFPVAGGVYGEAFAEIGIGTPIIDAIGGTGFARTATQPQAVNTGAQRAAGLPAALAPDLVLFGMGLNDNANAADAGLGLATGAAALQAFTDAVRLAVRNARAFAPSAVIAMVGVWTPSQSNANYGNTGRANHDKTRLMRQLLAETDAGPWVFVDPEMGEIANSRGLQLGPHGTYNPALLSDPNPTGVCWMTGTGRTGAPANNGNADLYQDDGVHPNRTGTRAYGLMLAEALRVGLLAL
ncbi:hypothetical protein [Rubrivivax rivuli]|uniref:SGNH hydrolase-type esterase domain-containing protein n=1 Tax=Rubrivivax rivuli TaxID=1862385 RepID=A0A437RH58_9BURK|nr:hypothetical protein [Rubrivivax rivuli]RVU46106.1 hypothetical protein EOE66_09570 [Rubrivivax rivuli]